MPMKVCEALGLMLMCPEPDDYGRYHFPDGSIIAPEKSVGANFQLLEEYEEDTPHPTYVVRSADGNAHASEEGNWICYLTLEAALEAMYRKTEGPYSYGPFEVGAAFGCAPHGLLLQRDGILEAPQFPAWPTVEHELRTIDTTPTLLDLAQTLLPTVFEMTFEGLPEMTEPDLDAMQDRATVLTVELSRRVMQRCKVVEAEMVEPRQETTPADDGPITGDKQ